MGGHFKYIGFLTLAVMVFPVLGHNKSTAYGQSLSFSDQARKIQGVAAPDASKTLTGAVATTKIEKYPSLGSSYSEYVKNYETWKSGLSLTDLIRGSELGETSAPMSQVHWQHQVQAESTPVTFSPSPQTNKSIGASAQSLSFSDQARKIQGVAAPDASKTLTGAVATTKIEKYPSLGSSYSEYVKNYETWKSGLSLTDLIRGSELGETSAPMSQVHWQHQVQAESTPVTFSPSPQTNKSIGASAQSLSFSDQARKIQGVAAPDASKTLTGAVATTKIEKYPSLGSSYSEYVKNYETWKSGLSLTDLIRGSELGETSAPMSQVHWQHQVQAESVAPLVKTNIPTSTVAEYDAMVAKNKAEYESLKAQVNNVPAMIAAKQCAPAGSIVAGPIPACPTSADLANLLNKNQAKEKALLAQVGGTTAVAASGSGNSGSSKCAPAGIVAGPLPPCPTTAATQPAGVSTAAAAAPTVAEYQAVLAKNKAEYDALKAQIDNVPAMIAAGQCAPAGIVIGPTPLCPSSADLAKLAAKNSQKEQAMLAAMAGSSVAVADNSVKCAPAGSIVAGPLPPCPTTAATQPAGVSTAAAAAPTVAEYQAVLAKNKAEYDALKAQIDNVPAMIAAGQCAPAGIVIGPTPLCPSSADLAKLAAKNSQKEQAMLAAMAGSSVAVADNSVKCAPAGSIVAGPIPACPTGTNTSGLKTSPVVNINPESMAAAKCATAGSIVAGPVPACPTVTASSASSSLTGAALAVTTGPVWATQ